MPRGKVTSPMLNFVADSGDIDLKEEEKNGAAKFTLIEPEPEEEKEEDELVRSVHSDFADTMESSRPNFKFTLLLVTLFVAVNVGLITLLDDNKNASSPATKNSTTATDKVESEPQTLNENTVVNKTPSVEKPILTKQDFVEKPVLGAPGAAPAAPEQAATVARQPAAPAKPGVVQKPAASHAAGQDLLSIIGKN